MIFSKCRRLIFGCLAVALYGTSLSGQATRAPVEEAPLVSRDEMVDIGRRHDAYWLERSAERALELGLYDLAYILATRSLEGREADDQYVRAELLAIDALLAQEQWIEAVERLDALASDPDAPLSAVRLRRAMIAYAEADPQQVAQILDTIQVARLEDGDDAWFWFLRGWALQQRGDGGAARSAFENAKARAREQSPALKAQLDYLMFRSALDTRTQNAETVAQLQNALAENRGREVGFSYAQQLAVVYFDLGRVEDAIDLMEAQLAVLPAELGQLRAQFQLLQTMAAGLDRPEGRQAFQDLLEANRFPELMSIGLQQAFSRSRLDEPASQPLLETVLDRIIARSEEHALLDQALYYRAVFKFLKEDYVGAEEDAVALQRRFPSSPYRRGVLALQASSAWNRNRYRTAASYLQQMRSEFPDLVDSSSLSALIADCYLRAGLQSNTVEDFRNAAEAYATALSAVRDPGQGGPLFYQLVLARLRSGQIDQAIGVLDDPRLRALATGEMIWRSEWMLIKEMRRLGRVTDGYDRAQASLALPVSEAALKLRLYWLAVKLSLEAGQPEDTEYWVDQVEEFTAEIGLDLDEELVKKVKASALLSLAESYFVLDDPEGAVALLERLRDDYSGYEAALLSYIAQARYYSSIDRTVEAQQLLVSLADNYPNTRLAPMALYEAAVNAERRGQDTFLDQANKLLQRIANDYPQSEMVYYARLKQADLLRKLNKFGSAERIYEFLENEYAERPDRFLAQMSLADTLLAQSNEDPTKFEAAVSRLELLMDLPEAPLGLRVEAGYKLGQAWRTRGETLRAKQTFWLLYDLTIAEEPRIRYLSRKGRYWLARSLFALAEITKEEGDLDKATEFYEQILAQRLWGSELAKARLDILKPEVPTE